MSRTTKWKLEKMKVKVVFRLQFHATHIPLAGWDKIFVSLIPSDSGKITAKTSKSHVRNGTCKWADPIYETTRLLQDFKTKQYDEKLYKLVVAMGSSRSSLLGEANINLADYADASKPSSVALPLNGCNFGTVLHVTVQLLTSKTGFREFEQQSELRERGYSTTTHQNVHSEPSEKLSTSIGMANDQMEKASSKVRFQSESSEIPSLGEVDLTEDYADSAVGIDDSSNTSESLYAEKHDSSTHENESLKSTVSGDLGGTPVSRGPHLEKGEGDPSDQRNLAQGANDWVQGWSSDYSMDNDLMTAYEENNRLRGSLDMAESSILELKREMSSLQRHADDLGIDTQKCCQLLAKGMASGEELAKEVSGLKSECAKFKDEFQQFKYYKLNPQLTGQEFISENWVHSFRALQMRWQQGLLVMENKVSGLRKKTCDTGLERDFSFLDMDLEALQHVLQELKQDTEEVTSLLNAKLTEQVDEKEIEVVVPGPIQFLQEDKLDADQNLYAGSIHCLSKPEVDLQESHSLDATVALREKISELQRELEGSKTEQDSLARKLDQMECYYEAFIQELEENQKRMLGELHDLRNENSTCMLTITSCTSQMEKMKEDMNEQLLRFSEERHELESVNKELERRVISSETALKKARWNSSIAVDQLQKDLELLSFQVLSMFKTNENLIKQAFADTSQSCFQEYPEETVEAVESSLHKDYAAILKNQYQTRLHGSRAKFSASQQNEQVPGSDMAISPANPVDEKKNVEMHDEEIQRGLDQLDLLESGTIKLQLCQNQNEELTRQLSNALEDSRRSLHLHNESHQKAETELLEMYTTNTNLDVFSKVLQEVLYEARNGIIIMKEKLDKQTHELAQSTDSEELLMLRLQTVLEEVNTLRAYNEDWSTKFAELTSHSQIVEEKFHSMSSKNDFLTQKITEYEKMIMEYRSYKSQYEECTAEKTALMNLLEKETSVKCNLQDEVSSMQEELETLKAAANEQSLVNRKLEETLSFLRDKLRHLRSMMISYDDNIGDVVHKIDNKDVMNIALHLEVLQNKACEKILQLTCEKKDAEEHRNTAQGLLTGTASEMVSVKKMYELDMQRMVNKLGVSMDLVGQLQLELASIAKKLGVCLQSEENYAAQLEELSLKLSGLTIELQNVVNENNDLSQSILALECVNEELERTKLIVIDTARKNEDLVLSLQSANTESALLSNELDILTEKFNCLRDDLNSERSLRIKLEDGLAAEVKMKDDLLISFDEEKAEVIHLKHLVSDLELEKSRLCCLLLKSEDCLRKADEKASSFRLQITGLETQLAALQEYLLAADVELIHTRTQFRTRMQELVQQLESLDGCYRELYLKHLDVLTTLNGRISSEAQYVEENARLRTVLDSLRSELEGSTSERAEVVNRNNATCTELEKREHEIEILKNMLLNFEELADNLKFSRDEKEVTIIVLRAKLEERHILISALEECNDEVMILQNQKTELNQRLSEQILKTEEFKNISIHLKELKDKADAECLEAREKREIEVPSIALQESLRMAFIREQCETKVQELRNQLFVSKKHGEEMLLKLQDALNEVESRRKSEASQVRRTEELLTKILELETELQMVHADKWEKVSAFDKMNAELECSLISLDCCKQEKQKLEDSLQECIEERTKIATELDLVKETLKTSAPPSSLLTGGDLDSLSCLTVSKDALSKEDACQVSMLGRCTSESVMGVSRQIVINQDDLKQLALINEHFKAQSLRSSMEQLHEELERMKNENLGSLPLDVNQLEPVFHGLQRQLLQLRKANEQLGSIFPLFNEFPGSGNAMERVLALEIELAEALQAKKHTNIHFQSSFLKQHADEEAVFQSFRDINELIKDMLELKRKYMGVETELKEMHDRYSQLSLQFAEVEGERQKLVMTLKNARSPKKTSPHHNSTSASVEDHS